MSSSKIYGLLGYPLEHSFSPRMHNNVFRKLNMPGEYQLFQKQPEELKSFLESLEEENIWGLNVTVPYKEKVLDLNIIEMDNTSLYAKEIRVVNTIVRKDGRLKGYNTDVAGFLRHLNKVGFTPLKKRIALLGAGGAGKAVAYSLAKKGAGEIAIFDLDRDKSESVSKLLEKIFPNLSVSIVDTVEGLDISHKDLLVNATPVGLKGDDPCLVDESMLHEDLFVYDLIYNPASTKLLSLAKAKGLQHSNGLGMLVYQGAFSFIYFTETKVPYTKIVATMWEAIEDRFTKR
ncbi:MAG: shikimate dehydrogenase [Candidatus Omnitrophota bacterium]